MSSQEHPACMPGLPAVAIADDEAIETKIHSFMFFFLAVGTTDDDVISGYSWFRAGGKRQSILISRWRIIVLGKYSSVLAILTFFSCGLRMRLRGCG